MPNGELKLQHVCMWTDHGWKRVTPDTVMEYGNGRTIHAASGLLKCELCGQDVTFVNGKKYRPFFKHSRGEADKNCPERSAAATGTARMQMMRKIENLHSFRLVLDGGNSFHLEVGFSPMEHNLLNKLKNRSFRIIADEKSRNKYLFERLGSDSITYLKVEQPLALYYDIEVDEDVAPLITKWSERFSGIGNEALFSAKSGKLIQPFSEVVLGKEYYLLTNRQIHPDLSAVFAREVKRNGRIFVYLVKARSYSQTAAKFFSGLAYHYFLTDKPVEITPIWPPVIRNKETMMTKGQFLFSLVNGDGMCETYPVRQNLVSKLENVILTRLSLGQMQQILYVSRNSHLLTYSYVRKDLNIYSDQDLGDFQVFDENNVPVQAGELSGKIPKELVFKTKYDGLVEIKENGFLINSFQVKADTKQKLRSIMRNREYLVYIGSDCIWKIHIPDKQPKKKVESIDDDELFKKLICAKGSLIRINHSFGSICNGMNDYPKTKGWVRKKIKEGYISSEAYHMLRKMKGECNVE